MNSHKLGVFMGGNYTRYRIIYHSHKYCCMNLAFNHVRLSVSSSQPFSTQNIENMHLT